MKKVNANDLAEEHWSSPKGKFVGAGKELSIALRQASGSDGASHNHPFDVEILRIPAGQTPYLYHSHSAQWEFYFVLSGTGSVRDETGNTPIVTGDAFIFGPGEAHQLFNDTSEDLVICVVADNPVGESSYYPDTKKWLVRSPERRIIRSEPLDYFDGEE
jgi:Uncharacterized conserved protein, contains double-stranded beta-helix domain